MCQNCTGGREPRSMRIEEGAWGMSRVRYLLLSLFPSQVITVDGVGVACRKV